MRWKGGKGGRIMRWPAGKGGRIMRWQVGKGGRVVRWEGGRFLVLFKGWHHRVSPRYYVFVSDVNQGSKGAWIEDFLACPQGWNNTPQIFCKLLKM